MGNTDSIPVVSQVKSGVQLITGDAKGAAKTQENFVKTCPGVSQVTSVAYLAVGEPKKAANVQKQFFRGVSNVVDGIPVVGHAKGAIHYIAGDKNGGDQAMKSASRTTGVVAGGVGGFFVGGPVGAVAGGIAGGSVMDGVTTVVDSAIHDEFRPAGFIAAVDNAIDNPNAGNIFDAACMPVFDGLTGYAAGKTAGDIAAKVKLNRDVGNLQSKAEIMLEKMEAAETSQQWLDYGREAQNIHNTIEKMTGSSGSSGLNEIGWKEPGASGAAVVEKIEAQVLSQPSKSKPQIWVQASSSAKQQQSEDKTQTNSQPSHKTQVSTKYKRPEVYDNVRLRSVYNEGTDYCSAGHINTMSLFEFDTVIRMGKADQGSLHGILRHSNQLANIINGFDLSFLSAEHMSQLEAISRASENEKRELLYHFQSVYREHEESFRALEILLYDWLREIMTPKSFFGQIRRGNRTSPGFRVGNGYVLIVGTSAQLYEPDNDSPLKNKFREIITFYVISTEEAERNKV